MIRVIHAPYDLLTPFDPRTLIFRIDEYMVTYFHENYQKVTFGGFSVMIMIISDQILIDPERMTS